MMASQQSTQEIIETTKRIKRECFPFFKTEIESLFHFYDPNDIHGKSKYYLMNLCDGKDNNQSDE